MIILLSELRNLTKDLSIKYTIPSYTDYDRNEEMTGFVPMREELIILVDWLVENLERTKRTQLDTNSDVADFSDKNYWAKI